MYHSRWKGNHYEAGFKYGSRLKKNNISLKLSEGFSNELKEEFDSIFSF